MKYLQSIKEHVSYYTLYHGTSLENAYNIIENGMTEDIYLGNRETAEGYAYSYENSVLIEIDIREIKYSLEPNNTLLNYYKDNLEEDEDYAEIINLWEQSNKTWLDSLNIIGSVILPPIYLSLTENDIIKLF